MPPTTAGAPAATPAAGAVPMPVQIISAAAIAGLSGGVGQGLLIDQHKEQIEQIILEYGPLFSFFWKLPTQVIETLTEFSGFV